MKKHLLLSALSFLFIVVSCDVMHFEPDCLYDKNNEQQDSNKETSNPSGSKISPDNNKVDYLAIYVRGTYELTLDSATIDGRVVLTSAHVDGTPLFIDKYNGSQKLIRFVYTVGNKQRLLELPLADYIEAIGNADGILVDLYFRETKIFNF